MICFGSYIKVLLTSLKSGTQQQELCSELIKAVGGDDLMGNHTKMSRLCSCEGNVPDEAILGAKTLAFNTVVGNLKSSVLSKLLLEDRLPLIILALKNMLEKDVLNEGTHLGKYTKQELLDMTQIDPGEFLTCFLIYVCAEVKNRDGKGTFDFITDDYVNNFDALRKSINITSMPYIAAQPLECTLDRDDFEQVFIESAGAGCLKNPNYSQVRLFYLNIENSAFAYDSLEDFLIDNIGYYVHSRTEMQSLKDKKKEQASCLRAIRSLNQHGNPGEKGTGNDLGEVMVYAFLEDVLGAPKIYSKAEIGGRSKTDGVHLLKLNNNGQDKFQLVMAASDISGDLKKTVASILLRLEDISKANQSERQTVDRAILSSRFDQETTKYLKDIIIPTQAKSGRPDIAFGIFIGYSLGIDSNLYDSDTYRAIAATKMKQDVEEMADYIYNQMAKMALLGTGNLSRHSFYFYFMPFDNADTDKDTIMKNLLSGGASYGTV